MTNEASEQQILTIRPKKDAFVDHIGGRRYAIDIELSSDENHSISDIEQDFSDLNLEATDSGAADVSGEGDAAASNQQQKQTKSSDPLIYISSVKFITPFPLPQIRGSSGSQTQSGGDSKVKSSKTSAIAGDECDSITSTSDESVHFDEILSSSSGHVMARKRAQPNNSKEGARPIGMHSLIESSVNILISKRETWTRPMYYGSITISDPSINEPDKQYLYTLGTVGDGEYVLDGVCVLQTLEDAITERIEETRVLKDL